MENSNENNFDQENQNYGSADADSGHHSTVNDNQYRQNSKLKNQPNENVTDSSDDGNSYSYRNNYNDRSEVDDWDENTKTTDDDDEEVDDQDLDENGFPRSDDSSSRFSI